VTRFLSPSSRLVLATIVAALIALSLNGSPAPATEHAGVSGQPGVAAASASGAGVSGATQFPSQALATPTSLGSASATPTPPPTRVPATPKPTFRATPKPVACTATDQDRYVYNPYRLDVQAACIRVTGVVAAVPKEADGDLHILLALDSKYAYLLRPANQGEELGDLVVEPVCVRAVTQLDAEAICASDPDPFPGPFPVVGEHIWMEGRYVFDLDHGGWAELHPLYRWGGI
jgi:hypothetical protein